MLYSLSKKIKDVVPDIGEREVLLIKEYLDELWRWNQKINLVGVSSYERVIDNLLIDALMAEEFIPTEEGKLLDIGSGAGFPSIPLKIIRPALFFHLVEARSKKAVFLRHIIRRLKLRNIEVVEGRLEDVGNKLFPKYDIIIFKAIKIDYALKLSLPYIHKKSRIITYHGKIEEKKIKAISENLALKPVFIKEYRISSKKRYIIVFSY